jgi:hypothetical protein
VEIWADTVSDFVFAPEEFLDPNGGRMEEGVYVGIISFDEGARELPTNNSVPVLLDAAGVNSLKNTLDTAYKRSSVNGTGLYYGVHKALANLKSQESRLPANLERVYVVTFTDGLDQNSYLLSGNNPIEGKVDMTNINYRTYLSDEIWKRTIRGKNIVAYSLGIMGDDVDSSDEENFLGSISSIASAGIASDGNPYYTKLTDWNRLEDRFTAISEGLDLENRNVTFNLTIPGYEPDTKVRITFDVQKAGSTHAQAAASQKYMEGTISRVGNSFFFTEISYEGMNADGEPLGSSSGVGPIIGTVIGSNVRYVINGLTGYKPADPDPLLQWRMEPGSTTWRINSEYDPGEDMAVSITSYSAVIYLVLDSSTSLLDEHVSAIRTGAKQFIDMIYTPISEGEQAQTYTVTTANAITGGTVSATPTGGSGGTTVTLSNIPDSGYILDYYTVNGTAISGNSFTLNGNVVVGAVFNLLPPGISNISYSGDAWTLQSNGWYRSLAIGHSQTTTCRVDFTSTGYDNQLVINLEVSSESGYDFAFVGALDDSTASYSSYFGRISGSQSTTITIPVPNPGSHFVEIGYRKDNIQSSGSDCAWFKIVN